MNFVGHINIEYEEIEYPDCPKLFDYVDYILHKMVLKIFVIK